MVLSAFRHQSDIICLSPPPQFRIAQRINATIYKPVEIYTALGLFFLAVSLPVNGLARLLKERYTRDISES